ncbi:MAG: hypothetical protein HY096_10825 [Nitrospinae bacterium]|nr:hypothetical protein [Nitrospinota bacterium]
MNIFEKKNTELIKEFNRYIREHPEFGDSIPKGAIVAMQMEGDEDFNTWSKRLAESQAEEGQSVIYVKIKRIKPIRSRIEEVILEPASF